MPSVQLVQQICDFGIRHASQVVLVRKSKPVPSNDVELKRLNPSVEGSVDPKQFDVEKEADEIDVGVHNKDGRKFYFPIFILISSLAEIGIFLYHIIHLENEHCLIVDDAGPAPICSALIYNPYRRYEAWRYISYFLTHAGWLHLASNITAQVVLGMLLEIVNGWWRVGLIYFGGVLTGSLLTSVVDPRVYLVGASGGVYALIGAHVPTIILNWKSMTSWLEKGVNLYIIGLGLFDLGHAIYVRYKAESALAGSVGYAAHFGGALGGLLLGLVILKNIEVEKWETKLQVTCILVWTMGVSFAIIFNAVGGTAIYPRTDWDWIYDCSYKRFHGC